MLYATPAATQIYSLNYYLLQRSYTQLQFTNFHFSLALINELAAAKKSHHKTNMNEPLETFHSFLFINKQDTGNRGHSPNTSITFSKQTDQLELRRSNFWSKSACWGKKKMVGWSNKFFFWT